VKSGYTNHSFIVNSRFLFFLNERKKNKKIVGPIHKISRHGKKQVLL